MARKDRKYKRLPGRPVAPFDVRSLWQGPDHLLWVETVFFKENYKRFYYKDIQAVILQRTSTHWLWSCLWGGLALIWGLIAFLASNGSFVSGAFTVVFLMALGGNLVLGPSCQVYVQTAAQIQKISVLKRVKTAQKAMTVIKALVESVQGPWENTDSLNTVAPGKPSPATLVADANRAGRQTPAGPYNPLMHKVLFGLLLVLGILGLVQLQLKNLAVAVLETMLHGTVQIMVIVALVRWYRHIKGSLIATINWTALVFVVIQTLIGYGVYLTVSFSYPQINYHHWAMFKKIFELQYTDHPLAVTVGLIYAGGSLLLGLWGVFILWRSPNLDSQ